MSTDSILQIRNFKKEYPNKTIAFDQMCFKKKRTILVGENGSGKSTILKAIMNIIHYEGEITGVNSMSYMPENPSYPMDITVQQFLSILSQKSRNESNYEQFLSKFRLKDKENDVISSLSKGMKAKLNLIQCLMREANLYILDEPLNGLDEDSVVVLVKEIQSSSKRFIISSHLEDAFEKLDSEVIKVDEYT